MKSLRLRCPDHTCHTAAPTVGSSSFASLCYTCVSAPIRQVLAAWRACVDLLTPVLAKPSYPYICREITVGMGGTVLAFSAFAISGLGVIPTGVFYSLSQYNSASNSHWFFHNTTQFSGTSWTPYNST